ncbi:hypothetical protein GAH_00772 [Geoglobus ahangari]|uniref:ArnR1-like winged helix-turn-helix domain-containing protein n=1 Tax=Geoglobus ahangari TaxID=113653 RepID=A0A0F7IGU5_9EURY|nr:hypothetical protein [Geoglobus ahangari]AKG91893.1 hypothetical protein GAH_00772 [Geoglobus ahangari]
MRTKKNNYEDFIKEDAEEMSYYDKLTLITIKSEGGKSRATRIQKLGLIINAIKEGKTPSSHGPYFYGGFSDDIEESLNYLLESGMIKIENGEYALTEYGRKILEYLEKKLDDDYKKLKEIVEDITPPLKKLNDRDLVTLTYLLFPELAKNSLIKEEIEKILESGKFKSFKIYIEDVKKK